MFHGKKEVQEALTQELRELTLMARGLGSRLEMLLPHISSPSAMDDFQEYKRDTDFTADRLANYYAVAVQRLDKDNEAGIK